MANFKVDILTPSSIVAKDIDADELLIPTVRGQINVLQGHTHFVSKLGTGILTVKCKGYSDRHFLMTSGVVKLIGDKVSLLSTVSERKDQIDQERATRAKKKSMAKLNAPDTLTDRDLIKYRRKLERAEARLKMGYLRDHTQ